MCPRCSLGRTGQAASMNSAQSEYLSRLDIRHFNCSGHETDDGNIIAPSTDQQRDVEHRRLYELSELLQIYQQDSTSTNIPSEPSHSTIFSDDSGRSVPQLLQVGCRDGAFLAQLQQTCNVKTTGLEVSSLWVQLAKSKGINTIESTLEAAKIKEKFDIIVQYHVLEHLSNPRQHLKKVASCLKANGLLVLEVPNLARAVGHLETDFLRVDHRHVFSRWSLTTLCSFAGLQVIDVLDGPDLRVICRLAQPQERRKVDAGPGAKIMATAAWANDLRLTVKRGLVHAGTSHEMLALAAQAHRGCTWAPGRADLAIEIAIACERTGNLEMAIKWLRSSLKDRQDSEIATILAKLEAVVRFDASRNQTVQPHGMILDRLSLSRSFAQQSSRAN